MARTAGNHRAPSGQVPARRWAAPLVRLLGLVLAGLAVPGLAVLAAGGRTALALPPAGSDVLPVVVTVDTISLLGEEGVILTGWLEIERGTPSAQDGMEVVDLEITSLQLQGASRLGLISVAERPNDGPRYVSGGELRTLQPRQDFPASTFLDLFLDIAAPASPFGALFVHNEMSLHLTPQEGLLQNWPPLGVLFELEPMSGVDNDGDGSIDEDTACVPLLDPGNAQTKLGLCVRNLTMEVAPALPSFSVSRGGASFLHPADILALTPPEAVPGSGQAPFATILCRSLGLSEDGCDDGLDGDQDDLDALSYGDDLVPGAGPELHFSVAPGAQGRAGSAVETQANCPPALPGVSPEPEPDVFGSMFSGTNYQLLDGNGAVGSCSAAFPLGLIESATIRDDMDALYRVGSTTVDENADGVPERSVYFSLDASSPSLDAFGLSAGDVLKTVNGAAPALYASASALGLQAGDDLDALCLREDGDGVFTAGDDLYYSLAPDSPTLAQIGAGPADLLRAGSPPSIAQRASAMGLLGTDDVNAATCHAVPVASEADGDVNCDRITNSIDAALVLQYEARLIGSLPCLQSADVDASGAIDGRDAVLILQLEAGLVEVAR